jgi:hypothetical protein
LKQLSQKPGGLVVAIALRCLTISLALISIGWAASALPIFWRQSALSQTSKSIIAGTPFKPALLAAMSGGVALQAADLRKPSVLADVAIFQLRVLEVAIEEGQPNIDDQMVTLNRTIRKSLANSPSDAFLWLVLFWLENTQNGFDAENFKFLRMSYLTGPNEGWVAVKRNRLAIALFHQLPKQVAEDAIDEFARLVDSRFTDEAAEILVGPGWRIRERLLSRLAGVDQINREDFARAVYKLGYDVVVPGVQMPDQRPWH